MPEVIAGVMVRRKGDPDPRYTFYPGTSNVSLDAGTIYEHHYAGPKSEFTTLGTGPVQGVTLTGGSMTLSGADLVLTPPVATGGNPTPAVVLVLMRGATNVTSQVVNNRINSAPVGTYTATWTAGDATKTASLEVLGTPQIVTASGVILPTGGLFDTMALGNIPGYDTLIASSSYRSTASGGTVGTRVMQVNGTAANAATVLKTGDVVRVVVSGAGSETPLTHVVGTVQWTWATTVNDAAQTLTFSDNPAAPDALAIRVPATVGDTEYLFQATLGEIRVKPIFAQGYPRLIQPDVQALAPGDTIRADVGVVIVQGVPTITGRLTRAGSTDSSSTGLEYQLTDGDYDTAIGFAVTVTDGRTPTSGSTTTILMAAPDVPDVTMPQLVAVGTGVASASGEVTISQPTEVQSGDKLLLVLSVYGPEPDPTIAGWTPKITFFTTSNTAYSKTVIYERTSTGAGTPVVLTTANAIAANIVAFRNAATISAMGTGHRDVSPYVVTGGAAPQNSLVLGVVSTRSGSLSNKVASFTNPALTFEEKSDVRTVSGTAASLTLFLARVPEGTTEFGDSLVTFPGGATVRNTRIHLSIQGAA